MRSAPSQRAHFAAVILLVDDNPDGILARQSVLRELGYEVVAATSGEDALGVLKAQKIDLVITDYKMNPVNGLELIREIRALENQTPIILLTGFAEPLGLRPETTGADIVLQKSANELASLLRHTKRLLQPPRKPAKSHTAGDEKSRSRGTGS